MAVVAEGEKDRRVCWYCRRMTTGAGRYSQVMESLLPIADLLNFLSDLVSPEGDEKHNAFANLTLKQHG